MKDLICFILLLKSAARGEIDDKDEDPDERIERAKKKLADMGFSEEHVNSVCFLPKEKALKFATDELSLFLRPILEDFDYLFGKLSSFDPKERKKAFITVIRAWEEAAEEWEKEERSTCTSCLPDFWRDFPAMISPSLSR